MRSILIRLLALSLLVLVIPQRAGALGLGDIKLDSYLNQPLNAKITLLPGSTGALDQVRVKLASPAAFEQAGIERLPVLEHIKFKVVKEKDGKPRIVLTSHDPIKEPFLDFILQVTWPNGQLSREYTVLLDPPTTTAEHAPPVKPAAAASAANHAPTAQTAAPATKTAAARPATAPAGPATRSIEPKLTHDSYGPTQRNDTLWSIAKAVRPDNSVSVQQVMLALVKKNPEAFYNDNVNTLKAGYVLRLPSKTLISQVGQLDAVRQVQRQYRQWQQIKQGSLLADNTAKGVRGAAPAAHKAAGTPKPASKPAAAGGAAAKAASQGAHLTLLPATADKAGPGGAAASTGVQSQAARGANGGALQQQLQSLKAAQEQQIDALRSQVDQLNQQVASMQRLLSLKDNSLATLQRKLGNNQGTAPAAPAAAKPQEAAPKPAPRPAAEPQGAGAHAAGATTANPQPAKPPAAKSARPVPKPAPHKVAAPPRRTAAGTSGLLADPKVLGMAGFVVLLLSALTWISVRRRRAGAESLATQEAAVEAAVEEEPVPEAAAPQEQEYAPTGGDLLEAEINEIDPLAEADVYMAYRRYQQAEDLLKGAIQQEPHRHELQLKLAEVFATAGNVPAFIAEAENLYSELAGQDSPIWDKLVEMGRDVQPDHPLFMEGGPAPALATTQGTSAAADGGRTAAGDGTDEHLARTDDPPSTDETEEAAAEEGISLDMDPTPDEELSSAPLSGAPQEPDDPRDNMIEFEPSANLQIDAGAAAAQAQPAAQSSEPHGNEIDFEPVSESENPAEASADGAPLSELAGPDPHGGAAAGATGFDTGEMSLADGAGVDAQAHSAVPEATFGPRAPGHDLDFDIDLDKIAGRDQDLDNLFEGLDGDGSPAAAGQAADGRDADGEQQDVGTRLDLAKAFMEMGDQEGAKEILREVVDLGDANQRQEAQGLLQQLQV